MTTAGYLGRDVDVRRDATAIAAYRRINLRWQDMRHEYASRLVEREVPQAQVRDLLGHASRIVGERSEPTWPKLARMASEGWLGVRDDFRNWLIRAA
jgi:hypothetical protein